MTEAVISQDSKWHLDKRVNISHIVATVILAGSIFKWGSGIENRIAVLESQKQQEAEYFQQQLQSLRDDSLRNSELLRGEISRVRQSQDRISDKLDRIIEGR
jgi:hypothetical protein